MTIYKHKRSKRHLAILINSNLSFFAYPCTNFATHQNDDSKEVFEVGVLKKALGPQNKNVHGGSPLTFAVEKNVVDSLIMGKKRQIVNQCPKYELTICKVYIKK